MARAEEAESGEIERRQCEQNTLVVVERQHQPQKERKKKIWFFALMLRFQCRQRCDLLEKLTPNFPSNVLERRHIMLHNDAMPETRKILIHSRVKLSIAGAWDININVNTSRSRDRTKKSVQKFRLRRNERMRPRAHAPYFHTIHRQSTLFVYSVLSTAVRAIFPFSILFGRTVVPLVWHAKQCVAYHYTANRKEEVNIGRVVNILTYRATLTMKCPPVASHSVTRANTSIYVVGMRSSAFSCQPSSIRAPSTNKYGLPCTSSTSIWFFHSVAVVDVVLANLINVWQTHKFRKIRNGKSDSVTMTMTRPRNKWKIIIKINFRIHLSRSPKMYSKCHRQQRIARAMGTKTTSHGSDHQRQVVARWHESRFCFGFFFPFLEMKTDDSER